MLVFTSLLVPGCDSGQQLAESTATDQSSTAPIDGGVVSGPNRTIEILQASGETMGTYYQVTIADPPLNLPNDWEQELDLTLRRVNDQMSTYLKSSELSRFNALDSTEWFPVSAPVVKVVDQALAISAATDGAFDITVGPLVDAWSFGPGKRTLEPPPANVIEELRALVDYRAVETRVEPPALRKSIGKLRIDLSSIAKGYAVDKLVDQLRELGCEHGFVDIGGENRAIGQRGNRSWRVAIEDPVEGERTFHLAFELTNRAIATSGDYRNFFEFEGQRYSHTIDPRTGMPVTHDLAVVSVFADNCMLADGWATALNVVGPERAMEIATKERLAVRIVRKLPDGTLRAVESELFPENIPLPKRPE
ncbi:FAD:protein FMN transferase [Planctomycetaceae bacterium SH139]